MSIANLKTLLTIRDTGSFQAASTALNLSHSAVSVQMKQLEQRLDRVVFRKGKRPAQFTAFGNRFCTLADPVVADYDRLIEYARESLHIIAPKGMDVPDNPLELLKTRPFIGYAENTWLGAQIHTSLSEIGVRVKQTVELDSIDAIEALVNKGVGVSVVPQRMFADPLANKVQCLEFPVRNNMRVLSLIFHRKNDRKTILQKLMAILGNAKRLGE
jgi:DNA-binding transcriptional LysR family regulator